MEIVQERPSIFNTTQELRFSEKLFNRVFRTMVEKMPELLIPLVNEAYGADYLLDTKVVRSKSNHQDGNNGITTASYFQIENDRYHVEFQSVDGSISPIQAFWYDIVTSIEEAMCLQGEKRNVYVPKPCMLYVRSDNNSPEEHTLIVKFPDGKTHPYRIPCVYCDRYSLDEIFEENLLLILPYYITRYQNEKVLFQNKVAINQCLKDMKIISERLEKIATDTQREDLAINLTKLIVQISDYIFEDNPEMKEGIEKIMISGAYILETERLKEAGREDMIINALKQGTTVDQIIQVMKIPAEEVLECERKLKCTQ